MKRIGLVAVLALATFGGGTASAVAAPAAPEAHAAKRCKPVNTHNGGRARFINTSGNVTCRRARRVAARARSGNYDALGFKCKPSGKPGPSGRLYGCGGTINGKAAGIGFFYKKG